jgi:hypothetical protein
LNPQPPLTFFISFLLISASEKANKDFIVIYDLGFEQPRFAAHAWPPHRAKLPVSNAS